MLKVYTLAALLAMGGATAPLFAQEEVKNTTAVQSELARGYIRPSLTVIYVTDGSEAALKSLEVLRKQSTEQFDHNTLSLPVGTLEIDFKNKDEYPVRLKEYAENFFKEHKVGQGIMHCWFPKFDEKEKAYSLDFLAQRAAYGATDSDILTAEASKRGKNTSLMTLGERMIDRSYVQVVYLSVGDAEKKQGVTVNTILYKLDFGSEVSTNFYEKGFNSANGIDKTDFPLTYVNNTKEMKSPGLVEEDTTATNKDDFFSNLFGIGGTPNSGTEFYENLLIEMGKVCPDFEVKGPIAETGPLRAKLGLKEGLKIDDRFFVMEQEQQPDGTTKDVRRAVVRVGTKIVDNRKNADGHSEEYTTFYQVGGRSYDKGMTLVSKKDLGIYLVPLVSNNFVGVEAEIRTSRFTKIPGTFIYGRFGLPLGSRGVLNSTYGPVVASGYVSNGTGVADKTVTVLQGMLGLRKEFNFARFLNLSAHIGFGGYGITLKDEEKGMIIENKDGSHYVIEDKIIRAFTANAGARFGVQVSPLLNLFVGAEYGVTFGDQASLVTEQWGISPISASLGARFNF